MSMKNSYDKIQGQNDEDSIEENVNGLKTAQPRDGDIVSDENIHSDDAYSENENTNQEDNVQSTGVI
jgi:hypothetical protein